ncbi:MAG: transcription antitermination factor NusB [Clostridia bacterium]
MSRKKARETAFKLLYQTQINKDDILEQLLTYFEENPTDDASREYIQEVVTGVNTHLEEIDASIRKFIAASWKIERISKIDLSILRLGYYEIVYRDDIPKGVAINEAVEIAKEYGSDQSGRFVNGVLANIS